jgi:hypothetical protein
MTAHPMFYGKPLVFNPGNHVYRWDGQHIPSVTGILRRLAKQALIQWAANCAVDHIEEAFRAEGPAFILRPFPQVCAEARTAHERIRDAGADVGTRVHAHAKKMLTERAVVLPEIVTEEEYKALQAFMLWLGSHDVKPEALERKVMSRKLWYAGTCDFWGRVDGKRCVLDFKTSKGIYDDHWLQTAAYEIALREELDIKEPIGRWLIHLDKSTGTFKPYFRPELGFEHQGFMHLVGLDRVMREMEKLRKAAA